MEEKFKFLELKISLKNGNTISSKEPGTLYINDRRAFFRSDHMCPNAFQCGFIPLDAIYHIAFDEA